MKHSATLLVPYLALIRVGGERLVIMPNSLFGVEDPFELFDLKGSSHGRASAEAPYKDLDMAREGVRWQFRTFNDRASVLAAMTEDAKFLASCRIIDYSLLLALGPRGQWTASVIDCATVYTPKKRIEHALFGAIHGRKVWFHRYRLMIFQSISCVPPKAYADRFVGFLSQRAIVI